ncbi:MAG: hypothetical protein B6U73_05165 [Desulfurococcales archaeon ex4484_204]|nr:MAG: hypothetical protein B6U73_05165 [Desulfurococcales archaeon ex4484_204]
MRKPKEEAWRRYVEGSVVSALRLYRHWVRRGLNREEALRRAVKQAVGMIESSHLSEEEVIKVLEDLRGMAEAIISKLRKGKGVM